MSKPVKHGDKWRIRWLDEHGKRQSDVFDDYKVAQTDRAACELHAQESDHVHALSVITDVARRARRFAGGVRNETW